MATSLDRDIEKLEEQKEAIDSIVAAIKTIREGMHIIPPNLAQSILDGLRLEAQEVGQEPPKGNYERVVQFLRANQGRHTVQQIVDALKIPRASLNMVLYGKHKDEFDSEKIGQGRTLGWQLRNGHG